MKKELAFDGSLRYDGVTLKVQEENMKSTLTISKEGVTLAVIEGNIDIDSVELESNTVLRIKDN